MILKILYLLLKGIDIRKSLKDLIPHEGLEPSTFRLEV